MQFKDTVIGLELGSTRIKAVLLSRGHEVLASGGYEWENKLVNGIWTYSMDEVHKGLTACFADLKRDVKENFGETLTTAAAIGISGMMHGYLPFDKNGVQLAEFRTWRNTITGEAAAKLSELFCFNVPQRWSIAHLYQAILNGEEHVKDIDYITTLAGYIHWKLTGEKVMGIGEASGMFPIDSEKSDYCADMLDKFDSLIGFDWKIRDILPKVLCAGDYAGKLTEEGAKFLDPDGDLVPGIPFAPCEGDAGTGMVATNSVRVRTGNVSAGTSDFAMLVSDKPLGVHREIDMVTTPSGFPVAMVHCSNCTSDINAWAELFSQLLKAAGVEMKKGKLLDLLFEKALSGAYDCGGLLSYNYISGEGITDVDEGRAVFARMTNAEFSLENFMRTHLMSAMATLKIGLDILRQTENVQVDKLYGHGGFFKAPVAGQKILSAAANAPVSVMKTAGEGGPYGMALLAAYLVWKNDGETLEDYLDDRVFAHAEVTTLMADKEDIEGFERFLDTYKKAFPVEKAAIETLG